MFLTQENIFPQTVYIHYSTNGVDYTESQMQFDGNLKYFIKLPYLFNDDLVDFYFTYDDNTGAISENLLAAITDFTMALST